MNLTRGINLKKIAEAMPGASGAEIKVSVIEIYFTTLYQNRPGITYSFYWCTSRHCFAHSRTYRNIRFLLSFNSRIYLLFRCTVCSLFHMKITASFTNSSHQNRDPCYLHLLISFLHIHSPLLLENKKL